MSLLIHVKVYKNYLNNKPCSDRTSSILFYRFPVIRSGTRKTQDLTIDMVLITNKITIILSRLQENLITTSKINQPNLLNTTITIITTKINQPNLLKTTTIILTISTGNSIQTLIQTTKGKKMILFCTR